MVYSAFLKQNYFFDCISKPLMQPDNKKGLANFANPLSLLEAAMRFERMNNGFADRCLSHLAMPPGKTPTGSTGLTGCTSVVSQKYQ